MSSSYWRNLSDQRASRRAVLAGGASLAGAAALLAACGGGGSSSKGASGAVKFFNDDKEETPVKTGGTYKTYLSADPASLDPYRQTAAAPKTQFGTYMMNRLVNFKIGPGTNTSKYEVKGDLVDSWEISDGGLTYTFKLRKGVKFHNTPPVNGHLFDSEDVMASWKRFSVGVGDGAVSGFKQGSPLYGGFNTVDSISAPDKDTVVFKVKKPDATFLTTMGAVNNGLFIFPREADVTYDPMKVLIGTGPWMISNYVPTSFVEHKRNPEYFEKGLPYMDSSITYFIPEAAQQIAQFQAGAIFWYEPNTIEEFQALTEGHSDRRIIVGPFTGANGINFARLDPESPFVKDDRVRKALSLAIDRTTIIEEFNDIEKYKKIGVDREYRNGHFVPSFLSSYWIDPRGPEMGESAQWFQFDVAKAKQLLSAAGYPNGFEFAQRYASRNTGPSLNVHPVLHDTWAQAGFKSIITPEDYDAVFNARSWRGEANGGIAIHGPQTFPDPAQQIDFLFGPTGTRNALKVDDPILNAMQDKNLAELDFQKRRSIIIDELKYLGGVMRHVPFNWTGVAPFGIHQPQVRNNYAYRTDEGGSAVYGTSTAHWWLAS